MAIKKQLRKIKNLYKKASGEISRFSPIKTNYQGKELESFLFNPYSYYLSNKILFGKYNKDIVIKQFCEEGIEQVRAGKISLYNGMPRYDEALYLSEFSDVKMAVDRGAFVDGFEHFLTTGMYEMIKGTRRFVGVYLIPSELDFYQKYRASVDLELLCDGGVLAEYNTVNYKLEELWDVFISQFAVLVAKGKKKLYNNTPKFKSIEYLNGQPDLVDSLLNGGLASPLDHFLRSGAMELHSGQRHHQITNVPYVYVPPTNELKALEEIKGFAYQPLISVVMPVYNVAPKWLELAVESLDAQWYKNWELCICDDASSNLETLEFLEALNKRDNVKVHFSKVNQNISLASNEALKLASGEYIALMDNDDELSIDALYEVVKALQLEERPLFIYSDEDKIELNGEHSDPHFKPDFSPDMIMAHNYMSHLGVIEKNVMIEAGAWRKGFEGAQDFDLYLRVLEITRTAYHIPKVLYHWRKIPGSTAAEFSEKSYAQDAGRMSLSSRLNRLNIDGTVVNGITPGTYRVRYHIKGNPKVSIVIPFRDQLDMLRVCLDALLAKTSYQNIEIICIDNQSSEDGLELFKEQYSSLDNRIRFELFDEEFNYSRINNEAVKNYSTGEYILLLNNDIEIITPDWIEGLLEHAQRENVGAVGAKLLFGDSSIQHAGIVYTKDTTHLTMNVFQKNPHNYFGYFSRLQSISNYSIVTAAMLLVKKTDYIDLGGLDEDKFKVAYNDVDFCLRLLDKGKVNIYTPFVEAFHYESLSRGNDTVLTEKNLNKLLRNRSELHNLRERHKERFKKADPFYSNNLSQFSPYFDVAKQHTPQYETVMPKPYGAEIVKEFHNKEYSKRDVCIFVHFDKHGIVDDYVVDYLKRLNEHFDVIFVTHADNMSDDEISKVTSFTVKSFIKKNFGYDFAAWKFAIDVLGDRVEHIDGLLMCNDSCYGPFSDISELINKLKTTDADVVSLTDSYEIRYHLQSFFVYFKNSALTHDVFNKFWREFVIFEEKSKLIVENEIGLSQKLLDGGLVLRALVPGSEVGYLNNMHFNWKSIIDEYSVPFVKVELLRDNPEKIDISGVEKCIKSQFDYPYELIASHIKRVR